jgi:hypothetical protein
VASGSDVTVMGSNSAILTASVAGSPPASTPP